MSETPAAGPPCDICQDEPAVMSEMTLADYSTVYVGLRCIGAFYTEMAANLREPPQGGPAEPLPPAPPPPAPAPPGAAAGDGQAAHPAGAEAAPGPRRRPAG